MGHALPWPPLQDVACRVAVLEHASRLMSRSKAIAEAMNDLLIVALTTASLRQNWDDPREWQN